LAASGMALGAFSASACVTVDPPLPELLDPVAIVAFFSVMFGFGGGAAGFLASACIAVGLPPPELCTYSTTTLLGACYPTDGAP
jgi:hypothetical protein